MNILMKKKENLNALLKFFSGCTFLVFTFFLQSMFMMMMMKNFLFNQVFKKNYEKL